MCYWVSRIVVKSAVSYSWTLYVNIYLIGLGLEEGVVYQMRVSAVTVNGTGPFSSWVQMVVANSGTGKVEMIRPSKIIQVPLFLLTYLKKID